MEQFYEAYLDRLQEYHRAATAAVQGLPQAALDWTPSPEMNSIGVLIVHLCGAERYLIGEVIGGDPAQRDRPAEFRAQGVSSQDLIQRLQDGLAYTRRILEPLRLADLESEREWRREDAQKSVAFVLAHALAHAALHVGHLEITRQLWDLRAK